jgi:hypothetical protein
MMIRWLKSTSENHLVTSDRRPSRNLPSVFDIARRLGLLCIFGGLVSIYIDVEVYFIHVRYVELEWRRFQVMIMNMLWKLLAEDAIRNIELLTSVDVSSYR